MATRSPAKKTNTHKTARKPVHKTVTKSARKPARKTATRQTAAKSARKPARKPAQPTKAKTQRPPRLASLNDKHFSSRLHQHFIIRPESGEPIKAELVSVTKLGPRPLARKGAARPFGFSIVLRTPQSDTYLPQHIYSVEHSRLGKHKIFLVPIGPDEHGMCYEAVFD
jgi:hypothetical protein